MYFDDAAQDVMIGPGLLAGRENTLGSSGETTWTGTPRRLEEEVRRLEVLEQDATAKRQKIEAALEIARARQQQLTLRLTPLPKVTSPDTVRWSSSSRSGMDPNLARKAATFLKWLSPSFTSGVLGNIL